MSLGTIEQRTEGIKKQAQQLIEQAYYRGFKAGREDRQEWEKDKADRLIEQGRNEAWEAAGKLMLIGCKEVNNVLSDGTLSLTRRDEIFSKCTASEAIERIREYEEKQKQKEDEIKVGDEVVNASGDIGVVIGIINNDVSLFIYGWNISQVTNKICCKKTGRHFPEIAEVLKKLKEGE
jgi:hypothetical protein